MSVARFCGQERCLIDANGRIRLSPRFEQDFRRAGALEVVLHCLPEAALGIYPVATWDELRAHEPQAALMAASSVVARRQLRRFGAMTQIETLTNQGRLTVPLGFRDILQLVPGAEVMLVGCEIGVEIWNAERWQKEVQLLWAHEAERGEAEMKADVASAGRESRGAGASGTK